MTTIPFRETPGEPDKDPRPDIGLQPATPLISDNPPVADSEFNSFIDDVSSAIGGLRPETTTATPVAEPVLALTRYQGEDRQQDDVIDIDSSVITEPPSAYRTQVEGAEVFPNDVLEDAAILEYELDRRRRLWWKQRRWLLYVFVVLTPLMAIIGLIFSITGSRLGTVLLWLSLVTLLITLGLGFYSWLTRPRVLSFGRVYRRYVAVPLDKGGLVWNDPTIASPDFPSLRDNFFALYRDSDDLGAKIQHNDDEETDRKKRTLLELQRLITPLKGTPNAPAPTPYVPRELTSAFDDTTLQPLNDKILNNIHPLVVPLPSQVHQLENLEHLAREVEDYAGLDQFAPNMFDNAAGQTNTIHTQIASKVTQNLEAVGREMASWQERADRERAFNLGVVARYREAEMAVRDGYNRVESALETEIRPASQRLEHETTFFRAQITRYYAERTEEVEDKRDAELARQGQMRQNLEDEQYTRQDEQRILQAELKDTNEQRARLDNSTNTRFDGLKSLLHELVSRSYNLPSSPRFRSDYEETAIADDSEQVLNLLAQLRAITRRATSRTNDAINRYGRLRFEPLDELAHLEQIIAAGTKWQATNHLGNLINFRQTGQLLTIAGEVADAVGIYLDSVSEFERLNTMWCGLEAAVRALGLTAYTNQLAEAQRYLEDFQQALASLHSSLVMAPHSPEMARPSTFQNLYDLAAGLQRELDELGLLVGDSARIQERLSELDLELAQLTDALSANAAETTRERQEADEKLAEIARKQNQLLERLEDFKTSHLQKIRAHIGTLNQRRDDEITRLATGEAALNELSEISEKILQKHLRQSQRLLEEANQLRQGLENTISAITDEFERAALTDRSLRRTCELYVPIWYFQFAERPVWNKRLHAFARCYRGVRATALDVSADIKNSPWRFLLSNQPAAFYRFEEDRGLSQLTQADQLDYPAGSVTVPTDATGWLVENGWVSRWLPVLLAVK